MSQPLRFKLLSDGTVSVVQGDAVDYAVRQASGSAMASISVTNRLLDFSATKLGMDAEGASSPLAGARFALYREISVDGTTSMDYLPMPGYEDIVSAPGTGLLPGIDESLHAGSYYLVERTTPDGYEKLESPTRFTITPSGTISIDGAPNVRLDEERAGNVNGYRLILTDLAEQKASLTISKTVAGSASDVNEAFGFEISVAGGRAGDRYDYSGSATGTLVLDSSGKTGFELKHAESITVEGLPKHIDISVSEDESEYSASWKMGNRAPMNRQSSYGPFQLSEDETLSVVNRLDAPAPTDYAAAFAPFLFMAMLGFLLFGNPSHTGRRARSGRSPKKES